MVPLLGTLAWCGQPGAFLIGLLASLLSDVLDGWLARHRGVTSELGARLDSWGDLATYATLPLFAWWLWPELLRVQAPFLGVALVAYFTPTLVGFLRWRRLTSYHTWAAKGTAVGMGAALLCLFAGGPAWPFQLAVGALVLESLEELAITAVLLRPQSNVPTLWHAWRAREVADRRRAGKPASRLRPADRRGSALTRPSDSSPRCASDCGALRVAPGRSWP
jgi:CDP-diacylglycerol--glycerol-3-phosphate 3-phosphatidyltransferase